MLDSWNDDGRLYLVGGTAFGEEKEERPRPELSGRTLLLSATSLLLERGRREAATVLFACDLDAEVAEAPAYADAPVWLRLKAPAELMFQLQDFDRDLAWHVREALGESLPTGYVISEIVVQAALGLSRDPLSVA